MWTRIVTGADVADLTPLTLIASCTSGWAGCRSFLQAIIALSMSKHATATVLVLATLLKDTVDGAPLVVSWPPPASLGEAILQRTWLLTWLLVCFQYDFGQMLGNSQAFYRSQWVGNLAGVDAPAWRGDAFTTEVGPPKLNWGDITGGVMEGGDAGRQAQFLEAAQKYCRSANVISSLLLVRCAY